MLNDTKNAKKKNDQDVIAMIRPQKAQWFYWLPLALTITFH